MFDNSIKAIATEYDGIVFRSRLEAIFYRYLIIVGRDKWTIHYEPKQYFNKDWKPDFLVELNDCKKRFLIELKPDHQLFNFWKYLKHFDSFPDIEVILMVTPDGGVFLNKNGWASSERLNEAAYVQATNDVYFYISQQN